MKITKFGHCCLLIEEGGVRILTDPGNYSTAQDAVKGLSAVFITHEHGDHLHISSVKKILENNPGIKIFTTVLVKDLLAREGIAAQAVKNGEAFNVRGVLVKCFGELHAEIYVELERNPNIGFFINEHFFYPGDALTVPPLPVNTLALPVAGPWIKTSECIEYAIKINPKKCFPVHDAVYVHPRIPHYAPSVFLPKKGIEFFIPELGKEFEV